MAAHTFKCVPAGEGLDSSLCVPEEAWPGVSITIANSVGVPRQNLHNSSIIEGPYTGMLGRRPQKAPDFCTGDALLKRLPWTRPHTACPLTHGFPYKAALQLSSAALQKSRNPDRMDARVPATEATIDVCAGL